jgi:hypothetical protein
MKNVLIPAAIIISQGTSNGADPVYRNAVMANNPVAYYQFDETEGTTAVDSSGNGKDGTFVGSLGLGAESGAPNLGTAVDFTGGHVEIPELGTFPQCSFEAWIQLDEVNAGCCTGIIAATGWSTGRVHINITFGLFEHAVNSDSAEVVRASPPPVAGEWYHLVVTNDIDSDETIFYVNGEAVADNGDHGVHEVFYGPEMQIGAWDGARQLDGRLDEVAVYDSVLSPEDVAAHYAAASGAGGASLLITGIVHGTTPDATPLVELTWESAPGASYAISYSTDAFASWTPLASGITADDGETTTRDFALPELTGQRRVFFRVEETN